MCGWSSGKEIARGRGWPNPASTFAERPQFVLAGGWQPAKDLLHHSKMSWETNENAGNDLLLIAMTAAVPVVIHLNRSRILLLEKIAAGDSIFEHSLGAVRHQSLF
jgi:hypothetical protein